MTETERRNQFIAATARQVSAAGIENLRTKQIAAEVGKSEGTLYSLFGSKESLLSETFEEIDRRFAGILLRSKYLHENVASEVFPIAAYDIWKKFYRYLVSHPDETIFFIRYQYSAYYTAEVRNRRLAYTGAYDLFYDLVTSRFPEAECCGRGFLVNYAFDLTLRYAEKVISGEMRGTRETEAIIWRAISSACIGFASAV